MALFCRRFSVGGLLLIAISLTTIQSLFILSETFICYNVRKVIFPFCRLNVIFDGEQKVKIERFRKCHVATNNGENKVLIICDMLNIFNRNTIPRIRNVSLFFASSFFQSKLCVPFILSASILTKSCVCIGLVWPSVQS